MCISWKQSLDIHLKYKKKIKPLRRFHHVKGKCFVYSGSALSYQAFFFLVSKETVVLRRWEIETEIYFIKRVDKGQIATVKDLES